MVKPMRMATLGLWGLLGVWGCSAIVDFDQCTTSADCKRGQACDTASKGCYDLVGVDGSTATGGSNGGATSDAAPAGGTLADAASPPDGGAGGTPSVGKAFGEACLHDAECSSGICMPDDRRCTKPCSTGADCGDSPALVRCDNAQCAYNVAAPLAPPIKVGFLYVGPVADFGWTRTHDEGRKAMEAYFDAHGIAVDTTFEPSVDPADAPAKMEAMIQGGVNVIVGTSYGFLDQMKTTSTQHKDVRFLSCSGFTSADDQHRNLGSYFGRMQQATFLAGKAAAQASQNGVIGVIGSVAIPELVRHINAFARGARSVKPDAEIQVRWVNNFVDIPAETAAAEELIGFGADVIWSSTDTQVAMDIAKASHTADGRQVLALGNDNPNACSHAPEICITTPYWNWGPVLIRQIQGIIDGTWDYRDQIWESIQGDSEESMVYVAPYNADLVGSAFAIERESDVQKIADGTLDPFDGPINDSSGTQRVAGGTRVSDPDLLSMCWFVEGVFEPGTGHIPATVPEGCPGVH